LRASATLTYCTVCFTDAELLAIFELPEYVALTVVDPTGSEDVVNVAFPLTSWPVPKTVVPAVKVTGPVGVTVGDVIVAVNVTGWPRIDGFGVELMLAELVV